MANPAAYALWRAELKTPTPEDRRVDRITDAPLMSGFWRMEGARTKPDWPVAIWTEDGKTSTVFQIGLKIMRTDTHADEWHDFVVGGWLKCIAVEQAAWSSALETKRWPDGKPAREITNEEKADIIPSTPASEGGNAPVDENGEPIDQDWEQIKANLERDAKALKELGPINSLDVANKAAEIIERMRANGTEGETRRKAEKKPHDEAAAKVQAKWVPVLAPASELVKAVVSAIDKWKRAEEQRLAREAAEEARKERERVAAEEAERLKREAAERAAQAQAMGMDDVQVPSDEEIAAEAAAVAAEQVVDAPAQTVRVGTAHGRAVSKATVWGGEITDVMAFFAAIVDHVDTQQFLQKKADALGRAKATVPGMKRVEK